ncbi:hypothetical protein [Cerasicoccus fimbriatus]|uniref:hypothetical protein n=1 Tax=Cerasicoccus fimbriatus TaxID=3014554 RepID=UPI0022B5900C|nr:hypothetical protein [Cerasicoccus sp. TK19100]
MLRYTPLLLACASLSATNLFEPLDYLSNNLFYETEDGVFAIQGGGSVEISGYYFNQEPVGFVFPNPPTDHTLFSPRLTLEADAWLGERLSGSIKFRWDDGIDPGYSNNSVRIDELFIDAAIAPGHFDVRVGRFATIFGNYVPRQSAWDNPFISPPLAYDQATSVTDNVAPPNATAFANRRNANINGHTWIPIIWGPVYTQGAAGFASWRDFDLAVSGTNRALSSRPPVWDDYDWSDPTFTGRLGWTPVAEWNVGLSGAFGAYLKDSTQATLPVGTHVGDYDQVTVGLDATWASGPWQVWAEALFSEFDVPNVSDPAQIYSYYVEGKYKITPQLYGALRYGMQFYNKIDTPAGKQRWDYDVLRAEAALGYKFNRHALIKVQYQYQYQFANFQDGENQIAGELVIKF